MDKAALKQRAIHEFREYALDVIYLSCLFGVMAWHRRLVLAAYNIAYMDYGVAIIEAIVLAKVIMFGNLLRLGRGLEEKPLIIPTLYKTVVFTIFVGLFKLMEETVTGLFRGEGMIGGIKDLQKAGLYNFLADVLVVFITFIPFFGLKELGRILGPGKMGRLFFRKRPPMENNAAGGSR